MEGETFIHPTAIIDEGAVIGRGCKIWAWTHIREKAIIGDGCTIGERVSIGPYVSIGKACKIGNNADLHEGVTIEDEVFIGPGVQTTNDIRPEAKGDWLDRFRRTLIKKGASVGAGAKLLCGITLGQGCQVAMGAVVCEDVRDHWQVRNLKATHTKPVPFRGSVEVQP